MRSLTEPDNADARFGVTYRDGELYFQGKKMPETVRLMLDREQSGEGSTPEQLAELVQSLESFVPPLSRKERKALHREEKKGRIQTGVPGSRIRWRREWKERWGQEHTLGGYRLTPQELLARLSDRPGPIKNLSWALLQHLKGIKAERHEFISPEEFMKEVQK